MPAGRFGRNDAGHTRDAHSDRLTAQIKCRPCLRRCEQVERLCLEIAVCRPAFSSGRRGCEDTVELLKQIAAFIQPIQGHVCVVGQGEFRNPEVRGSRFALEQPGVGRAVPESSSSCPGQTELSVLKICIGSRTAFPAIRRRSPRKRAHDRLPSVGQSFGGPGLTFSAFNGLCRHAGPTSDSRSTSERCRRSRRPGGTHNLSACRARA